MDLVFAGRAYARTKRHLILILRESWYSRNGSAGSDRQPASQ
jgi:hypothetical protein